MASYWNCLLALGLGVGIMNAPGPALAAAPDLMAPEAEAKLMNKDKETVGTATLRNTPHGVLIHVKIQKLPEGTHAFHIHEKGQCDPPDFKSAGGHFNPTKNKHGYFDTNGFHLGDLPNIHVAKDGTLEIEVFATKAGLKKGEHNMLDNDGAALVVHEGADDYKTDPAGDAGPRIACGVVKKH